MAGFRASSGSAGASFIIFPTSQSEPVPLQHPPFTHDTTAVYPLSKHTRPPPIDEYSLRPINGFIDMRHLVMTLLLGSYLLAGSVLPAQAQEESSAELDKPPTWVQNFGKQLRASLESPEPKIKRDALQHITYFASFYGDNLDFSDTVPTLVELYRSDDDAQVRLFAVVALYAIGDDDGMQQVRSAMYQQKWPPRLQFVTMAALTSYYGAETFSMDREAAVMAENLMRHYLRPRVEVGPLEVVQPQMEQR